MMRDDSEWLHDILEAIERIERYASQGREIFDRDELVQTWMIHHIQIIDEATRRLSDELRARYPAIPWSEIIGMRNILVHDYFGVDLAEVWSTVEHYIPSFKYKIEEMLRELEEDAS